MTAFRPRSWRRVGGLHVAATSTFPTAIGVNPRVTVMAMAKRVSRTLLAEGPPG